MILYINGRLIFWAMPILDLIGHLYNDIALTFAKIVFDLDASTTAQIFNHKLTGLDSQGFLQSNLHTSDGMLIVIMIMLFLIMYQFYNLPNTENLHAFWLKLLLTSNEN